MASIEPRDKNSPDWWEWKTGQIIGRENLRRLILALDDEKNIAATRQFIREMTEGRVIDFANAAYVKKYIVNPKVLTDAFRLNSYFSAIIKYIDYLAKRRKLHEIGQQ